MIKNPLASAGDIRDLSLIPRWVRSPGGGHGNPLQYSCLEYPMDRGAGRATVHRVAKSWTCLSSQTTRAVLSRPWGRPRKVGCRPRAIARPLGLQTGPFGKEGVRFLCFPGSSGVSPEKPPTFVNTTRDIFPLCALSFTG